MAFAADDNRSICKRRWPRTRAPARTVHVSSVHAALQMHLRLAMQAYGGDLVLPQGEAQELLPAQESQADESVAAEAMATGESARESSGVHRVQLSEGAGQLAPAAAPHGADELAAAPPDPLQMLAATVAGCTACVLHKSRDRTVFGEGNPRAEVFFVGEAPGANEDKSGRPFVGEAGQLLTRIINGAMGLRRKDVYIANVVKCRPPANRTPLPDEAGACLGHLQQQLELIAPKVIVCLGRTAAHHLLGRPESVGALRGKALDYRGTPVVVTWHPAFLLRDASHKPQTWQDIMRVNQLLGRPEKPAPVQEET